MICLALVAAGCSAPPASGPVQPEEEMEVLRQDLRSLFAGEDVERPLTLHEALARGIAYNLDHRLAVAQEAVAQGDIRLAAMEAFPDLDLKGQYVGRSSEAASSSRSVLTGRESLEPSFSTDSHRRTSSLDLSWNLLDTGLAAVRGRQVRDKALITAEQRRKVVHNIVQDVRYAYWRAAVLEESAAEIETLLAQAQKAVDKSLQIEQARLQAPEAALGQQSRLLESMNRLMEMRAGLAAAKAELAGLINLPPDQPFTLAPGKALDDLTAMPPLATRIEDLERLALHNRPELQEELYNRRIAAHDLRLAVFETFPGFEALFGVNRDSNSFLENQEWASFSVGFTQSLMKLFTLPARTKQAKNQQALADLRRQALAAAIMAQVRISTTRLALAESRLGVMKQIYGVNTRLSRLAGSKRIASMLTAAEELEVKMDMLNTKLRAHMAFVDAQNAYGQVLSSIGIDPLPEIVDDKSIAALAKLLEDREKSLEASTFPALLNALHDAETKIMDEAASSAKPPRKPKIPIKKDFKQLQTQLIISEAGAEKKPGPPRPLLKTLKSQMQEPQKLPEQTFRPQPVRNETLAERRRKEG